MINEDHKRLESVLRTLSEHYDCVQIFANRHESGEKHGTVTHQMGIGNWYARYGQVREWVNGQEERARQETRDEMTEERNNE